MSDLSERALERLRQCVCATMSQKRFAHTLGTEQTVAEMAALYCPEKTALLRAAALLHDVTKEYSESQTKEVLAREGVKLRPDEKASPQIWHAITAALEIPHLYPDLADAELLSCVRWHTTGREGMTLTEQLLYLADYIDMSRTFHSCVVLRRYFWGAEPENMDAEARLCLLRQTLAFSFDLTMRDLLDDGALIARETVDARNELMLLLKE